MEHQISKHSFYKASHGFTSSATSIQFNIILPSEVLLGCAIAQVVSCWLPTVVAQVQAQVWQVGSVVDKVVLGQVFIE
jgi:hypothetical protein